MSAVVEPAPVLSVEGLSVTIDGVGVVSDVSLSVDPGECVALVGASGSGKTVTARALLGLSTDRAVVTADRLDVAGTDARALRDRGWRKLRGSAVGYVGQEALGALDPLRPVGREVADALRLHTTMTAAERVDAVRAALAGVGLDPAIATDGRLAGTLSGGMRQRALIAAATIGSPALVVADEPTTALDAGVAVTVMEQLRRAQQAGAGLLVITHDLGLVAGWADRVAVVSEGRVVEQGPVARVFAAPEHPATAALVHAARAGVPPTLPAAPAVPSAPAPAAPAARCDVPHTVAASPPRTGSESSHHDGDTSHGATVPDHDGDTSHGATVPDHDGDTSHGATVPDDDGNTSHGARERVLGAEGLARSFGDTAAVRDVSFALNRGRVLGVIGASGSGKTTLARLLLGLETPDDGTVALDGEPWAPLPERDRRSRRHRVSAVVQDPGATFDERWDVERVLADAFSHGAERRARGDLGARVDAALRQVGLVPALRSRSPLTLSGGQRQRLAIARSLATEPEVLVLDEPVTALDATVQDAVLGLLERLRDETGVAMLFVSHDLRAVRRMADDVLVVHEGAVVEHGPAATVFGRPAHPVTARLLHAAEVLATGPAA